MKKVTPKKTTRKRQSASRTLPLSRSKKTVSKKTSQTNKKKPTNKSARVKQSINHVAKKVVRKKQKQLHIWFGPGQRIVVTIKRTKLKKSRVKNKKQTKPSVRLVPSALITAGVIGSIFFGQDVFKPAPSLAVYSPPVPQVINSTSAANDEIFLPRSRPTYLRISVVGIDTVLSEVGRKANNTLEVPNSTTISSWYKESPAPGEKGPAVIVGHVDGPEGPAVFWRIRELVAGQRIEITREDGKTVQFEVDSVRQFDQAAFPTQEVYGNIDHAGLRLITCGGNFNRLTGNYSHNTVVFASLVQ